MCYSPYNVQIRSLHHLTFRLASTSILDVFECLECDGSTSLTLFRNSFVCPIRNPKQARIKHRTTHTPSITHIPILANKAIQLNHSNFHFTMEPRYLVSLSRRCEAKPANQPTIPPCLVLRAQPGYTRRNDSPSRQNPGKMAHSLLCEEYGRLVGRKTWLLSSQPRKKEFAKIRIPWNVEEEEVEEEVILVEGKIFDDATRACRTKACFPAKNSRAGEGRRNSKMEREAKRMKRCAETGL